MRSPEPDLAVVGRPAIRMFTDKDGLPQNAITALAFDRSRYLWAGTKDGAAFYNGREWQPVAFPDSLPSTWIKSILVASDGSAWFGTLAGIGRFDGTDWTIYGKASGLPGLEVADIVEGVSPDGAPVIFAATNAGVAEFDGRTWTALPPIDPDPEANEVRCVFQQRTGDGDRGSGPGCRSEAWPGSTVGPGLVSTTTIPAFRTTESRAFWRRTFSTERTSSWSERTAAVSHDSRERVGYSTLTPESHPMRMSRACSRPPGPDDTHALGRDASRRRALLGGHWTLFGESLGLAVKGVWSLRETPSPNGARTLWIGTSGGGLARWEQGRWIAVSRLAGLHDDSTYGLLETN